MEEVAIHLQREATQRTDPLQRDQFGRSAFNRFYYATFIPISKALAALRPEWAGLPHKDVPEVIRGTIIKALKDGQKRANRLGDYETVANCARAISLCHELAGIMESGYAVRVAADYHAEVAVDFATGADFRLVTVPVSIARQWPGRAAAYSETIGNIWRQIGEQ